ncbi:Thimet oligopeptidase [Polychytrium aggregatum]|uniref:Thimet oligopeptidase n=1 Tax=Polychytrium aggregatum TaxID=110093 RepID=UPI0022FE2ADC|nr:Thimet oligopeptidase [Polychytrium aggregatum]KAI9197197.1 Thimet oligopeptidase [Polychytrium aggregatum]
MIRVPALQARTASIRQSIRWSRSLPLQAQHQPWSPRRSFASQDSSTLSLIDKRLRFNLTPAEIESAASSALDLQKKSKSFSSSFGQLAQCDNDITGELSVVQFLKHISTEPEVRATSTAVSQQIQSAQIEISMRSDVYRSLLSTPVSAQTHPDGDEDSRLVEKTLQDYERNGLGLSQDRQDRLRKLRMRISELCLEFSKNLADDRTVVKLTRDELEGLPEAFLQGLEKATEDGIDKYIVTMKYPDIIPVMKLAKRDETRKRLYIANSTRCAPNIDIMQEVIQLRNQCATLMGCSSHAEFQLQPKMAKTPEQVLTFLNKLREGVTPIARRELQTLIELKQKEKSALGQAFDGQLHAWDVQYYSDMLLREQFQVDHEKIKEYYSLDAVTKGMLDLYEKILQVRFVPVESHVWHPDVQLIRVDDSSTGELVGHFYLDLFPRDGKYTHAACFPLLPGHLTADQQRQSPVAAMVANFPKPRPGYPSLLKHGEIITYFHELGHVMHEICSKTKWARFHGTNTEWDFVETPSQMFENWCWNERILTALSSHYQTGDKIPQELVQSLIKSRNVNAGLNCLRQIFFGLFDMRVHGLAENESVDVRSLWQQLMAEVTLIPGIEGTCGAATFGHIMGGYDAGYYGYLWSEVYSTDLFETMFSEENILNGIHGRAYRDKILGPGGSKNGIDIIQSFLGRRPEDRMFLKRLGI